MSGVGTSPRLSEVEGRLNRWRQRHGGPGVRIPEELWSAAAEVAEVEGVCVAARRLRLREAALARRLERASRAKKACGDGDGGFLELDVSELSSSGRTVVVLEGEGDRLRVEVTGAAAVDVIALARAFWSRTSCSS